MAFIDTAQLPLLDGYLELGQVASMLGVSRQTAHFHAWKVGAFPGIRRFGNGFPTYLVPETEFAAFLAQREAKGDTRVKSADMRPIDKDTVPALEGWLSVGEAAACLVVVPMAVTYMIEHGQFDTVVRVNRRNSLALRIEEVRVVHGRRLRAWAVARGYEDISDLAALDAAFRLAKENVTQS